MCVGEWEITPHVQFFIIFFASPVFVNVVAFLWRARVWITHRQDEEREAAPQGKLGGNERNGSPSRGVQPCPPASFLLQRPLHRQSSLLENKSAFNNQREATASRNADGFSGDMLETTRGA